MDQGSNVGKHIIVIIILLEKMTLHRPLENSQPKKKLVAIWQFGYCDLARNHLTKKKRL